MVGGAERALSRYMACVAACCGDPRAICAQVGAAAAASTGLRGQAWIYVCARSSAAAAAEPRHAHGHIR